MDNFGEDARERVHAVIPSGESPQQQLILAPAITLFQRDLEGAPCVPLPRYLALSALHPLILEEN